MPIYINSQNNNNKFYIAIIINILTITYILYLQYQVNYLTINIRDTQNEYNQIIKMNNDNQKYYISQQMISIHNKLNDTNSKIIDLSKQTDNKMTNITSFRMIYEGRLRYVVRNKDVYLDLDTDNYMNKKGQVIRLYVFNNVIIFYTESKGYCIVKVYVTNDSYNPINISTTCEKDIYTLMNHQYYFDFPTYTIIKDTIRLSYGQHHNFNLVSNTVFILKLVDI